MPILLGVSNPGFSPGSQTPTKMMRPFRIFRLRKYTDRLHSIEKEPDVRLNLGITRHALSPEDVSGLWKRIQQGNDPLQGSVVTPSPKIIQWYWVAAAVVIGIAALILLTHTGQLEYRTAFGETKTVVLPDRSTVILNANSHISFYKNWDQRPVREIWLDGEAYFSVVPKENHQPFRVSTAGGVAVEVLGTTFNVYHRAVETKVVLNSGKISLSFPFEAEEKKIVMNPGDLVEFKKDKYSKRVVDPRLYASWTDKKIILDQTSLREMVKMANDYYGVEIDVSSEKMLDQTVSGSMPIGDAESFVNQVAKVFQLKVVNENNKFLFKE